MRKLLVASVLIAAAVRADEATPSADVWTNGKLAAAAQLVRPAFVTGTAVVPELERQRLKEAVAAGLKVDNDVELGSKTEITQLGDAHFRVHMGQGAYPNWFILRITNVPPGGKTVRFDLDNANVHKLITANPVFAPLRDLADSEAYSPTDGSDTRTAVATSGATYPTAAGLAWQFIPDVWRSGPGDISFVRRFDRDAVVALRVPYGLGYHAAFVKSIEGLPTVAVHTLNETNVIEIGSADETKRRNNPHVLVYTREDGCQQDGSWFIEGAAQFLIGDTPEATAAREQCTFLLIPIIDPAAARESKWSSESIYFDATGNVNPLVNGFRDFLGRMSGEGRKIVAAFDLFTPESAEYRTMSYVRIMPDNPDEKPFCEKLQKALGQTGVYHFAGAAGTKVDNMTDRLVAETGRQCGARQFMFFINSQDRERHLSLDELRQMGGLFAQVAADYFPHAAPAPGHGEATKKGHQ